jgi:hypothetical protein
MWLVWRGRISAWIAAPALLIGLIACAPYLALIAVYGSPAPDTPAQQALLVEFGARAGWTDAPRLSLFNYVATFLASFVDHWMPAPDQSNILTGLWSLSLVVMLGCALAGFGVGCRRVLARNDPSPAEIVCVLAGLVILGTLCVHIAFSYQRHLATGWMMDAYPRYYLPLIAFMPLGCLLLASALPARWRQSAIGFFAAQPLLFLIVGTALGAGGGPMS